MKYPTLTDNKILTFNGMQHQVKRWRLLDKKIAFTNGCFDILHQGHLEVLSQAATLGDILVVGINTDASVKKLKGKDRPVNDQLFRARMLAALTMIDAVVLFDQKRRRSKDHSAGKRIFHHRTHTKDPGVVAF